MKKLKRIICIIMAAVILAGAPLTSYMEVQAVEVIALPFVEDLLLSLGISFGLGDQLGFWQDSRKQALDDYFSAVSNGSTITLPNYGPVDFSDSGSVGSFFEWSIMCNKALLGSLSPGDHMYLQYHDTASALDKTSYHNTGTSATNAMNDSISDFYDDYGGSFEALAEDIQACFNVIKEGGKFNDDDASDEEKAANRRKFWLAFSAITAAGMIGYGNGVLPLTALVECGSTDFSEYDALFGEAYFDGSYEMNADGKYVYKLYSDAYLSDIYNHNAKVRWCVDTVSDKQIAGYVLSGNVRFVASDGSSVSLPVANSSLSYSYISYSGYSGNIPIYPSQEAAINALKSGDFSNAENLQSSYSDFKSNTKGANAVVGNPFSNYVASLQDLSDLAEIIPGISGASDAYGGTAKALKEVADILNRAAGIAVVDPDPGTDDSDSSSTNYFSILRNILSAINGVPAALMTLLVGKFMTADGLTQLLNSLPALFDAAFSATLELCLSPVITSVNSVAGSIAKELVGIFPASDVIEDAIIGFPAAVAAAVGALTIPIPDIVIPDIAIPDIVIPEIVIPDIAVPDVFVDLPAITLNPAYNITVANDWLGLDDVISKAVQGIMIAVFVPNQALALEKVGEMQEYFKFKDEIVDAVDDLKTMIFGITPSPVLKIPIGKTESKKYKYGTGDYIIIDVSWYAPYKQFGDKVVIFIAWALFLWRMFLKLPGIISGTEGSIMAADKAYQKYSSGKD